MLKISAGIPSGVAVVDDPRPGGEHLPLRERLQLMVPRLNSSAPSMPSAGLPACGCLAGLPFRSSSYLALEAVAPARRAPAGRSTPDTDVARPCCHEPRAAFRARIPPSSTSGSCTSNCRRIWSEDTSVLSDSTIRVPAVPGVARTPAVVRRAQPEKAHVLSPWSRKKHQGRHAVEDLDRWDFDIRWTTPTRAVKPEAARKGADCSKTHSARHRFA
jgi:hypothetical protein